MYYIQYLAILMIEYQTIYSFSPQTSIRQCTSVLLQVKPAKMSSKAIIMHVADPWLFEDKIESRKLSLSKVAFVLKTKI